MSTGSAAPTDDRSLRVLHLVAPARAGGLESVIVQLTGGLAKAGHDVRVAAILDPSTPDHHPFLEAVSASGVPVERVVAAGRAYRDERRQVRALLDRFGVSVLHTHGYRPDVLDGPVAIAGGRAHVMTLHGFVGGGWRDRVYEWLQIRAARRADAAIAVSAPIVSRIAGARGASTVHLLPNAVAPDPTALDRRGAREALGVPDAPFVVGWVGRVSAEKGPDVFVQSIARSPEHVHGVIVGDGPLLMALRDQSEAAGILHRLTFTGLVPGASRYLAAFDALALTSHTEGTPMVLLEAMWGCVPIVATAVGGVPQLVGPDDAILCAAGDAPALAAAFAHLSGDAAARSRLSASARARVAAHFGYDAWITAHIAVYRAAIARASRRRR